jgi:hypothetical protein
VNADRAFFVDLSHEADEGTEPPRVLRPIAAPEALERLSPFRIVDVAAQPLLRTGRSIGAAGIIAGRSAGSGE